MFSPIKYFGGKGGMSSDILPYFPKQEHYVRYVEPFGGSFAMCLAHERSPIEVYNDLEKNVYSLYKCLQDKELFEQFRVKCELINYNEDLFKESIEALENPDLSIVERAYHFFFINRCSMNGIGNNIIISSNSVRRKMCKLVSDILSAVERLPELHDRLSAVIVSNRPALEIIKLYDNESTFFYLDPPYCWETRRSNTRYKVDMNPEQQIEFLDLVTKLKGKCLISGYDNVLYNEKLKDWNKVEFTNNNRDECLWFNYGKEITCGTVSE